MKKRYKIPLIFLTTVAIAAGGAYALVPWKNIAAQRLALILQTKGFENVRLSVESAGMAAANLRDITIGSDDPLTLRDLTVKYHWRELLNGTMRDLAVNDLNLTVRQVNGAWIMQGFRKRDNAPAFTLPVTDVGTRRLLPFDSVELKNARLAVITPSWRADIPADAAWKRLDGHALTTTARDVTITQGPVKITAATATLSAALDPAAGQWSGTWAADNITVTGTADIPTLSGSGTITAYADHINIDGQLKDKEGKIAATLKAEQYFADSAKNKLTLVSGTMPWKSGTLRVRNVAIPIGKKAPIRFDLIVDNVSLDELMQAMTGKRVNATGVVSGTVPLVYNTDGSILPGTGALSAGEPGTITMPPDAIPGDNEQIALTRDILANFHYDNLSITTEQDADGRPVILLSLLGNNPDVYDGRAVKLNVRLTGDVLDFIRNNVILLTTPEKLLKQETP